MTTSRTARAFGLFGVMVGARDGARVEGQRPVAVPRVIPQSLRYHPRDSNRPLLNHSSIVPHDRMQEKKCREGTKSGMYRIRKENREKK